MPTSTRAILLCFSLMLAIVAGCQSRPVTDPVHADHARVLSRLYGLFIQKHKGVPPRHTDDLRAFAKKLSADQVKAIGADPDGLDKIFVSPRDKQLFVFRDPAQYKSTPGEGVVVAYEQDGVGGKRLVIFPTGRCDEVDAAKFKELVPEAP